MAHGALDVVPLLESEQPKAEGAKVGRLVALQGHTGCCLQTGCNEFFAGLDVGVGGVADHHARRFKAGRGHTGIAGLYHHLAHLAAQLNLFLANFGKAVGFGLEHHLAQTHQRIGGQGGVVDMAAGLVGLHHLQPFAKVHRKGAALGLVDRLAGVLAEHDHGAARRAAPAFLGRRNQHVHAGGAHVDPHGARGDAVEHQQPAVGMHRIGQRAQVAVGQHHAGRGLDMGREHQGGFFAGDGSADLFNRGGRPGRLRSVGGAARFHDGVAGRDLSHVEDLAPAVAEPAVAHHHHVLAGGKLPGHGFHAKGSAAGHQGDRMGLVDLFEHARDVTHHALKALGHVVERAVGVDH